MVQNAQFIVLVSIYQLTFLILADGKQLESVPDTGLVVNIVDMISNRIG